MANGMTLTDAGRNIIALAMTGKELHFTRGALGDGITTTTIDTMTALVHERKTLGIKEIKTSKTGTIEVTMRVTNEELAEGFWLREYGLYATHPDTGKEVLYAYCGKGDRAGYLEGYDGNNPVTFELKLITIVDKAGNITVELDSSSLDRLERRVAVLEQAFAGYTPEQTVDRVKELEALLSWNGSVEVYEELSPDELAERLRKLSERMSWGDETAA